MMNLTRAWSATTRPMSQNIQPSNARTLERRQAQLGRAAWAWVMDTDLDTVEKFFISFLLLFAVAIEVLQSRLLLLYPPAIQGFALTLPAPVWSALLATCCIAWVRGRRRIDFQLRHKAALASGLCCGALCGPLAYRAATLLVFVIPAVVILMVVAWRLKYQGTLHASALKKQGEK